MRAVAIALSNASEPKPLVRVTFGKSEVNGGVMTRARIVSGIDLTGQGLPVPIMILIINMDRTRRRLVLLQR